MSTNLSQPGKICLLAGLNLQSVGLAPPGASFKVGVSFIITSSGICKGGSICGINLGVAVVIP